MGEAGAVVPGNPDLLDQRVGDGARITSAHSTQDRPHMPAAFRLDAECLPKLLWRDDPTADQHLSDLVIPLAATLIKRRSAV